ncbi:FtsX-like permease family protein [Thalassotalea psychrophila]|uniref:FtsX-like permease family protein n=1 Tax=Thalassotalea psychrophila TaxID=3065647 RepID=A0ABY9TZ05_9GAMM|nr:FtsX-like permease family protein [Colwelliaceae bacterium SQ149]
MPIWVKQSLRLFRHELKRGELTIICLAIILAVATVFSLSGFSQQIQSALINESNSFIAADRVLQSSRPASNNILAKSKELHLDNAEVMLFSSMVFAGDEMQLASVKAVSSSYPLRGELLINDPQNLEVLSKSAPASGTVWVQSSLLEKLSITIGDKLELGAAKFTVAGTINKEPDASFSVFTQGPRVFINLQDVESTQVVQPGSRLTYRYLFAGTKDAIDEYEEWVKPHITDIQRWYDVKSQQTPLANALTRAEKYLSLASMLGIILAAVAVSVASRRYGQRHQPMVAVFKAMGANRAHIRNLYLLHWTSLSLFSIIIGLVIGFGLQTLGLSLMADYLPNSAKNISSYPLIVATVTGIISASAFAITPMKMLISTPVLAVIHGFGDIDSKKSIVGNIPPVVAIFVLLMLFSRDWVLSLALMASGGVIIAILLLLGRLLINTGRSVGSQAGQAFHLAMANLKRRGKQNNVQLVSFTIAINLLLLMLVVRNDLINEWQAQLPVNAPNQFLVNVSKQQVPNVESFLTEQGMNASELYPIVRGRLTAINEEKLLKTASKEQTDKSDQGRQGIGRELNMTWHSVLPKENIIVQGQWFSPNTDLAQVSIESKLAERLEIKIGDQLSFQIGSEQINLPVTSIREVNWQSMQPNFYMIFSESVLTDFPATYIAAMHVPEIKQKVMQKFLSQYPTITVIDVQAMISQLRSVIEQVSLAIEFILALVVLAGSLVLVAQVQASMEERERELAILRTLGAKGSLLKGATVLEFVILGAIAGFMASIAMEIGVYVIQTQVFEMQPSLHLFYWFVGIGLGALFVGLVGLFSCWRLLNLSSLTLIRRTL